MGEVSSEKSLLLLSLVGAYAVLGLTRVYLLEYMITRFWVVDERVCDLRVSLTLLLSDEQLTSSPR